MSLVGRWWPFMGALVLLVAAGAAASMTQLPLSRVDPAADTLSVPTAGPEPTVPDQPPAPTAEAVASAEFVLPHWVLWVFVGFAAAVAVSLVVLLFRVAARSGTKFSRRRLPVRRPTRSAEAEVMAAVDAGLLELDDNDADPRRAVIACWVRLEAAARIAGVQRLASDTSTDLVLRLLEGRGLDVAVLTGFADVYRMARYAARREVDPSARDRARAALTRLRAELTEAAPV